MASYPLKTVVAVNFGPASYRRLAKGQCVLFRIPTGGAVPAIPVGTLIYVGLSAGGDACDYREPVLTARVTRSRVSGDVTEVLFAPYEVKACHLRDA
jgi:hypothetical protein